MIINTQINNSLKNKAIKTLISAWRTQIKREKENFHIPAKTMRHIVAQAIKNGRKAINDN